MRLSDLLAAHVVDADGIDLGAVRDVRLVQDGPLQGAFGAGLRVLGLVVGPTAVASRLGYDRRGARGPWPVAVVARWFDRRTRYVPWSDVASLADGAVTLRCRAADLEPPAPLTDGRPV